MKRVLLYCGCLCVGGWLCLLGWSFALAKQAPRAKASSLAERLVKLRASIDQLTGQIQIERTQHLAALRGLEQRRSRWQLLIEQAQLRRRSLIARRRRLQQAMSQQKDERRALRKVLLKGIEETKEYVQRSLPYRRKERLAALEDARVRLNAGRMDASEGVAALWRLLEDELRLTQVIERANVPMVLAKGQPPRIVHALRIGMIALFVREKKGQFGRMVKGRGQGWRYLPLREARYVDEVARLFRRVERQHRQGRYVLPLFAPSQK